MSLLSIAQLSRYSGVKPHTIRAWEKRYNALNPDRSTGNTRYYNSRQLRRLLNIVSMQSEHKLSALCKMSDRELAEMIVERGNIGTQHATSHYIPQLIDAGLSYDALRFEKLFDECLSGIGVVETYVQVIYPLLERVGLLWSGALIPSPKEHFISNLIRQKLLRAIDELPVPSSAKDTWLLFLPEDEYHEIGLIFAHYLLRRSGKQVIYLGSNVPDETVSRVLEEISPEFILLFKVHYEPADSGQLYIDSLSNSFRGTKICVAGNERLLSGLKFPENAVWLRSVESLEKIISSSNPVLYA